jgi:uncharacterized membrane protein YfcA
MSVTIVLLVLAIGVIIGVVSGMVGIGGGVLVIPVLMIGFGFSQAKANGTSLAMLLPPIGIFAVLSYWRAGNIDWWFAGTLAVGFAGGALIGAKLVNNGQIDPTVLRVIFAALLFYVAIRTLFRPAGYARSALEASLMVGAFVFTWYLFRLLGKKWNRQWPDVAAMYQKRRQAARPDHDYEI